MRTCSKCLRVCCLSFCSARTYFFSMLNTWRGYGEETGKKSVQFRKTHISVPYLGGVPQNTWPARTCKSHLLKACLTSPGNTPSFNPFGTMLCWTAAVGGAHSDGLGTQTSSLTINKVWLLRFFVCCAIVPTDSNWHLNMLVNRHPWSVSFGLCFHCPHQTLLLLSPHSRKRHHPGFNLCNWKPLRGKSLLENAVENELWQKHFKDSSHKLYYAEYSTGNSIHQLQLNLRQQKRLELILSTDNWMHTSRFKPAGK